MPTRSLIADAFGITLAGHMKAFVLRTIRESIEAYVRRALSGDNRFDVQACRAVMDTVTEKLRRNLQLQVPEATASLTYGSAPAKPDQREARVLIVVSFLTNFVERG